MNGVFLVEGLNDPSCGLGPMLDAARLVQPGLESVRPLTLGGVTSLVDAENLWRDRIFTEQLAPFFLDQLSLARRGLFREILELDRGFCVQLDDVHGARSRSAGKQLVRLAAAMRGDRLLPKLAAKADGSEIPCHYLTVFAARSAAFSIDDRTAIGAYVIREVCGWSIGSPAPAVSEFIRSCLNAIPASRFGLRAA